MAAVPAGIVFVNNDLIPEVQGWIVNQLHITEVIGGATFDGRVAADPEYVNKIKQLDLRLLVVRSFLELQNRDLADLILFIKNGMAAALKSPGGPPQKTIAVVSMTWSDFCKF